MSPQKNKPPTVRPFFGYVTGYCDNEVCVAREVEIHVKCFGGDPARPPCCPMCGLQLSHVQWIDAADWDLKQEWEARCSVNVQRYVRDHGPFVPLAVMLDDSLLDAPQDARTPPQASNEP